MRRAAVVICAAAIAALSACTMEPHYARPAAPVGPTWNGNAAGAADKTDVADVGWRDFFPDPVLQQLIALALANNRDLRIAALNVEAAQAQYRIQGADLFPTIAATGLEQVQRYPAGVFGGGTPGASTWHVRGWCEPDRSRRFDLPLLRGRCRFHLVRAGSVRPDPQPQAPGPGAILQHRGDPAQHPAHPGGRGGHCLLRRPGR